MSKDESDKPTGAISAGNLPPGNDPARYELLLQLLDEKLQLGLLTPLKRVKGYHFEGKVLFLEPATPADVEYLSKESVQRQLAVYGEDACGVDAIALQKSEQGKSGPDKLKP